LVPLLLDGNLQYFCFLLFSQTRLGFSLNPRDKLLNVLNYLLYFLIVWFSVVSTFLAYWLSRRLAKYVLDNWRTRIHGLLAASLVSSCRMLLMGGLHSLLRSHSLQLPLLLGVEVLYVAVLLVFMKFWKSHRVAYRIWFTVSFALLRVLLLALLIVQQGQGVVGTDSPEYEMFESMIGWVLLVYMGLVYFGTAWEMVYEVLEIIKECT